MNGDYINYSTEGMEQIQSGVMNSLIAYRVGTESCPESCLTALS